MKLVKVILPVLLACLCSCSNAQVKHYGVKVIKEFPHSRDAYTQGLFFHDGVLYETTGQYGESCIRTVDLASGRSIINKHFGEGSCIFKGRLYVLTWTNRVAFRYNPEDLTYINTVGYGREGWGLTTDGKSLIASKVNFCFSIF